MKTATQFVRKCSTSDLFFDEPVLIQNIVDSRTGAHKAFQVVNANGVVLTLNIPDWFRDQYVNEGRVEVGDYISGGWNAGRFSADIWCVQ